MTDKPKRKLPEALKPTMWKKGCPSPNPTGRPHKRPISDRYAMVLEMKLPPDLVKRLTAAGVELPRSATIGDAIAYMQARIALKNTDAAKEIREAIEGKAPQRMEIASLVRNDINITVRFESAPPALEVKPNGHSGS
ncbi:MAG TPA: hypothetical protein VJV74_02345 [Terriglobia bacterium]|nr:hypothetical protein [Terriglobia bacterium]